MKGYFIYLVTLLLISGACEKNSGAGAVSSTTTLTADADSGASDNITDNPSPGGDETPGNDPAEPSADPMVVEFMRLLNNHRTGMGLKPLLLDEEVSLIVENHSQNMADGKVSFGHSGFSSRCAEARAALGGGNWCAENVAMGQKSAQAAFNAWLGSSGHRANMESTRATHTGFGYARSSSGTYYWTQLFIEFN